MVGRSEETGREERYEEADVVELYLSYVGAPVWYASRLPAPHAAGTDGVRGKI